MAYYNPNANTQWINSNANLNGTPYANQVRCNPCGIDPYYNPPPVQTQVVCETKTKGRCKNKNCTKCEVVQVCQTPYQPPLIPQKDPCPLKSFCDPGLANTCVNRALINPFTPRTSVTTWIVNYLVSNRANFATTNDLGLLDPWGIIIYNNQVWVANGTADTIANYDLFGNKLLASVTVRDAVHNSSFPTGLAVNCGGGFNVTNGARTSSAVFLICTEHGTVHAYNPIVNPVTSFLVLNNQLTGFVSVYKGIAVANGIMYLADFFQARIQAYDNAYNRLNGFYFIDSDTIDPIPIDYAPHNIVHIGCYLYVLYARKDPNVPLHPFADIGAGFVSVFNLDGSFVRRFTSRGVLNAPWAMIPGPIECGFPPGSFLIGNHGDGRIHIFDCNGRYVGPFLGMSGTPIIIQGLWGLVQHYVDFNEIFFTSAPDELADGYLGNIVKDQVIQF